MAIPRPLLTLSTAILALAITSFATELSKAENYPSRPVRVIVPYPPGSGNDLIARLLVQRLSEAGTRSYVENLPGAGGTIGTSIAAKAPADGYTIAIVNQDFVIQPLVKAKIPYDAFESFAPVAMVATAPESISIHPSLPATSIREVIALLRSRTCKSVWQHSASGQ